ncbi:MAG: insulinase family protein [Ignavibacteriae bacterium]|nr:insulinase family protein [Ignavibacteriota bacterium]
MKRNMSRRIVVLGLFTVAVTALCLLSGRAEEKFAEGKVYRHSLENGMMVLTVERHIAPFIYHQLTYNVGSRNERLGITGISHVVEHMMFKGTPKYKKGETSKKISDNAGIFNAFTSNDMTSYFEYLPTNKIELALDIESDRMQNCVFDPKEFDSEIQVILQERRMRTESSPQGVISEELNATAFLSHPNRDPIIGWPSDLKHVTRDEAFTYYKTYYTPNNAFLVLVGDFETAKMLETVKKYYGKISKGPAVPPMWAVEQYQRVRRSFTLYHNDFTAPMFRMAFHAPTYADSDAAALRLAGMILAEKSRDARLFKRLVEKEKLASSCGGGLPIGKDPGLFSISVSMTPDSNMQRAEDIVWEEIERMQKELVSDHELQKVKNRYTFTQVTEYTKNTDIGTRISRYETYFGWDFFAEFDKRIHNVGKEDVQRVMKKYFSKSGVTVAYGLPKDGTKKAKRVKPAAEDEEKEPLAEPHLEPESFYYMPPFDVTTMLSLAGESSDIDFPRPKPIAPLVKQMKLDNGITLYTVENHLVPALFVGGKIETGSMPEARQEGKPGLATVLADVMNRGGEAMTSEQFTERLAFVPFSFSTSGSYRSFSFQGYALTKDADEMMKTGWDVVTHPAFRDGDITTLKNRHMVSARDRFKKTGIAAFYYMFNRLFGNHVYSQVNSTEESIKAITKDDLKELHLKYFHPERATLVMMGDMTPDQMKSLANKYFGQWKNPAPAAEPQRIPPAPEFTGKEIKVFTENDYTECTINVGFAPSNNIDPQDREAVAVLNSILASSALTSRMGIELRDKQGLVYGIKSELWGPNDNIGYWKFNTKTSPKNAEKVIRGIFSEIRKLIKDGVTDEELRQAKQRQLGLLPLLVETPDDIASRVFELLNEKLPFDYFDKKADRIEAITKVDLVRIAKRYFTLDRFVIVVDGPLDEHALDHLTNEL